MCVCVCEIGIALVRVCHTPDYRAVVEEHNDTMLSNYSSDFRTKVLPVSESCVNFTMQSAGSLGRDLTQQTTMTRTISLRFYFRHYSETDDLNTRSHCSNLILRTPLYVRLI